MGPAWRKLQEIVSDGQWHDVDSVVPYMCDAGSVVDKTALGLVLAGKKSGYLERARVDKGRYMVRLDPRYSQTPSDSVRESGVQPSTH